MAAKRVFKYQFQINDSVILDLPTGAKILSAQEQHGQCCFWALVDPKVKSEPRTFHIAGTGHPIEKADDLSFIATIQTSGGSLVWHIFEVT